MIDSNIVESRCQPFLNAFSDAYSQGIKRTLRRGLLIHSQEDFLHIKVKKDRKPSLSSLRVHEAADDWFFDKFGIRARSQTIFCTSSLQMTKEYGVPHLVFPEGEFQTIHSPKVDDMFIYTGDYSIYRKYCDMYGEPEYLDMKREEFISQLDEETFRTVLYAMLESYDYRLNDLSGALLSLNEVMVYCDNYFISQNNNPEGLDLLRRYTSPQ